MHLLINTFIYSIASQLVGKLDGFETVDTIGLVDLKLEHNAEEKSEISADQKEAWNLLQTTQYIPSDLLQKLKVRLNWLASDDGFRGQIRKSELDKCALQISTQSNGKFCCICPDLATESDDQKIT